jgi:hypothetical protein
MKKIRIRANEHNNLLSIKPVEDTFFDRVYLKSIITDLFKLTQGCLFIECSRPNFEIEFPIKKLHEVLIEQSLYHDSFEVYFLSNKLRDELLEILPILWFGYQHIGFLFFYYREN